MKVEPVLQGVDIGNPKGTARPGNVEDPASGKGVPVQENLPERPPVFAPRLENLKAEINRFLRESRSSVRFSIDEDLERIIVKVVDGETGETIRQYPPSEIIGVMKRLKEMRGVLFDGKG